MVDSNTFTSGIGVGTQPPLSRINMLARVGQVTGFQVAWVIDHFMGFFPQAIWDKKFSWVASAGSTPHAHFDYQAVMAYLARKNMHIGVGVTEPIRRHPVLLAQFAMTLSHMAKKAPILGIGSGERENVEPYGLPFAKPVGRLEEALQVIRACFESKGPIKFEGEFFQLDKAIMDLRPKAGNEPQIWVAAHGPRMLRLTGQYGDGWYPTLPMTPHDYEDAYRQIQAHARRAGREDKAIVAGWQAFTVIGKTEKHAREILNSPPVRLVSLLAPSYIWQSVGLDHPFGSDFRGMIDFVPPYYSRKQLEAAMAKVEPELISKLVVWGTPETILEQMYDYQDAGLRHLVLSPASAMYSKKDAFYSIRFAISIQKQLRKRYGNVTAGS
ncbi:MAG: LLM class flavin-dependent oxidoreductase [Acidimicrobiia bacterium]|nr:LLM class flavin-dependent oxidoreductase [Acidimicrobiia bacterium]